MLGSPQVNLYAADVGRSLAFYGRLGFVESFRTPSEGAPIHVELKLDGFTLGIAAIESAVGHHGLPLDPGAPGRRVELVLWADDADAAFARLAAAGAATLSDPHDWLDGRLRVAWVADPDGNPIQLVQRRPDGG